MARAFRLDRDLVIIDVETTGISIQDSSIIQLGAVKFRKTGFLEEQEFNVYIKPYTIEWTRESQDIHHITQEFLKKNGTSIENALDQFVEWIRRDTPSCYLAQWSCGYDTGILINAFKKAKLYYPFNYRAFDVASITRFYLGCRGITDGSLGRCAKQLGILIDKKKQHDAFYDAWLTGKVLGKVAMHIRNDYITSKEARETIRQGAP